jgi:hypothetical protein
MTSIAQIQAQQKVLVLAFNEANDTGSKVEFTDPKESITLEMITTGPAFVGSAMRGKTGYVPVVTEGGEARDLPISLVKAMAKPEPEVVEPESEVVEPEPDVAEPEKPSLESLGLVSGASLVDADTKPVKPKARKEKVTTEAEPAIEVKPAAKPALKKVADKPVAKKVAAKPVAKPVAKKAAAPKASKKTEPKAAIDIKGSDRRIAQLDIRDIMGISEMSIPLDGKATMITGKNGKGKSSIIKALLSAVSGGYAAELVRNGAESGEVVLVMNDDSSIRKRIFKEKAGTVQLKAGGKALSKPQQRLNMLFDGVAVDPAKFLSSKPASQLEQLLEATPMVLTEAQLASINGATLDEGGNGSVDLTAHPIHLIDASVKVLNSKRVSINGQINQEQSSLIRLKSVIPEDAEPKEIGDLESRLALLNEHLQGLSVKAGKDSDNIRIAQQEAIQAVNDTANNENRQLLDRQAELRQQQAEIFTELQAIETTLSAGSDNIKRSVEGINIKAQNEILTINNQLGVDTHSAENDKSATERAIMNHGHYTMTLQHIKESNIEAASLAQEKSVIEQQIEKLISMKNGLITSIPIAGLEVCDGSIMCDGIPFKSLNTAKQAELAIRIAVMRLDTNPEAIRLIIVDGAECMDTETIHSLIDAAEIHNVQLLMAKTTDGPLEVSDAKAA